MSTRKLPIGASVIWKEWDKARNVHRDTPATILRHGYDAEGVYTEIKAQGWPGTVRVHRSQLTASKN
jgi:hypothetical protein